MEELPNNHHLDVEKNLVNRGIFQLPTSTGDRWISEPSTVVIDGVMGPHWGQVGWKNPSYPFIRPALRVVTPFITIVGGHPPCRVSGWKWSIHDRDRKLLYFTYLRGVVQPT